MANSVRLLKISYIIGIIISLGVGIWHFFTPSIYMWNSYISDEHISLQHSIIWINFLFSFFMTGYSILLLKFHSKLTQEDGDQIFTYFYGFFVFVWLGRISITILYPFTGVYDLIFFVMISIFILIFGFLLIPFLFHIRKK